MATQNITSAVSASLGFADAHLAQAAAHLAHAAPLPLMTIQESFQICHSSKHSLREEKDCTETDHETKHVLPLLFCVDEAGLFGLTI